MDKQTKKTSSSFMSLFLITIVVVIVMVFFNKDNTTVTQNDTSVLSQSASGTTYEVLKVIDGDTIKINNQGTISTIRLIGIDTPELNDDQEKIECFAKEASQKLSDIISDQQVILQADDSQGNTDRYGRILAYIFLKDGTNINQKMIADGYAYEFTYDEPYKYQTEFKNAEKNARLNKLGLWATNTCNGER